MPYEAYAEIQINNYTMSGPYLPCYVSHYYHNMELPRVTDGGDGLQKWRVTEYNGK